MPYICPSKYQLCTKTDIIKILRQNWNPYIQIKIYSDNALSLQTPCVSGGAAQNDRKELNFHLIYADRHFSSYTRISPRLAWLWRGGEAKLALKRGTENPKLSKVIYDILQHATSHDECPEIQCTSEPDGLSSLYYEWQNPVEINPPDHPTFCGSIAALTFILLLHGIIGNKQRVK